MSTAREKRCGGVPTEILARGKVYPDALSFAGELVLSCDCRVYFDAYVQWNTLWMCVPMISAQDLLGMSRYLPGPLVLSQQSILWKPQPEELNALALGYPAC